MSHVQLKHEGLLFCENCGQKYQMKFPAPIETFNEKLKAFETLHKDCPKKWSAPDVTGKSIEYRKKFWLLHGERGMSSIAIFHVMDRTFDKQMTAHPHDPADFKRCYGLLKLIPEWKERLPEMKTVSRQWSNLVDHWDELTKMFEENEKTSWTNYEKIGMHILIDKLTN